MNTVDIIIPTYKPTKKLFRIIEQLNKQTYPVKKIILINTEEKYFEQLVYGVPFRERYGNVKVRHISKREFDHGGTRREGVKLSDADIFICMTDDAVPADEQLVERLVEALGQEMVAAAYARQLADEHAGEVERFTREYNYPAQSCVKSESDLSRLGIKTYFCSNVCAAYRRDIYEELGGFIRHTIFNEDMIYAAGAVKKGYRIAYAADARVYHSHNYTAGQQLHRNFDLGVSQAEHPEVFAGIPSEGEGIRMVRKTADYLKQQHLRKMIPGLYFTSACKYLGYRLGKNYRRLPFFMIRRLTSNREYWQMERM